MSEPVRPPGRSPEASAACPSFIDQSLQEADGVCF